MNAEVVPLYGERKQPGVKIVFTNDPMTDDKWRRLLTLLFTEHHDPADQRSAA